jgi:hypothetical protein
MDKEKKQMKKPPRQLMMILLVAAGIVFLILGVNGDGKGETVTSDSYTNLDDYVVYLETRAKELAESVYGVSDVKVMISLEGGARKIYAADADGEYLVLGSGSGARLAEIGTAAPRIAGIGISCRGGENEVISNELTSLISAAFDVGMNKIHISPSD